MAGHEALLSLWVSLTHHVLACRGFLQYDDGCENLTSHSAWCCRAVGVLLKRSCCHVAHMHKHQRLLAHLCKAVLLLRRAAAPACSAATSMASTILRFLDQDVRNGEHPVASRAPSSGMRAAWCSSCSATRRTALGRCCAPANSAREQRVPQLLPRQFMSASHVSIGIHSLAG